MEQQYHRTNSKEIDGSQQAFQVYRYLYYYAKEWRWSALGFLLLLG